MSKDPFNADEYRAFIDAIPNGLRMPIELREGLSIYNLESFVTGRLNHIKAHEGYREPGNRSAFIGQLMDLRSIIEVRLKKREQFLREQAEKQKSNG